MKNSKADGKQTRKAAVHVGFAALALALLPVALHGGAVTQANPPSECNPAGNTCGCPVGGDHGVDNECIKAWLGLGRTTPWSGSLECSLKVFADSGSPSVFTPESLYAVLGGYTFKRLGQKTMPDGVTPAEVVFSHPNGEPVHFVFANGESLGRPDPGVHVKMDERLQMVDAEGWATAHDPVYYDLYVGDGTRRRFLATNATGALGALVSVTDARGKTATPADMGVEIIYDPNGVRQFLTPSRLADVTPAAGFSGYDVAVYALQAPPSKDAATGLYVLPQASPVRRLSLRSGNGGKRAVVTIQSGGGEPETYQFDYALGEWSLARPSGVRVEKGRHTQDERDAQIVSTTRSPGGAVLARRESNYKWESWGFAMTNRVEGFGGATEATSWTYYTSGNGKGQVRTEQRQSGLLIQYAYDNLDRLISETHSGPDMMTEATTYGYTPVDANDPALPVDTRPRTVVKTLDGIECGRTYYAYTPLTDIVERVGTQGAPYGGTNALRTVTTYYPVVDGDPRSGFVRSIRHEDGKLDLYDYALSSNLWTRTVTHLHEQSPAPVSGKTTRDITLTNASGEVPETRTEAYVEGIWHIVAREDNTYNAEGKVIRSENLAGQVTTTAWDCCHKVAETKPDGSTTTWDYDVEGRMVASSKLIPLDMTNVTWLTTCHEYDGLGRQTATWRTNYAAQVGTPATLTRYDALGRTVYRTDELGNATANTYSPDGLTVTTTAANGATTVHTLSAGGDTLSIAGSAVTPEFHAYGILPNGIRWSRTVRGETADAPRYTKRFENMLGKTVREERSGFRGALLATTHEYDALGRLARTIQDSPTPNSPTPPLITSYAYDALGDRIATRRLVSGGAGGSPAESGWRLTATVSSFAIIDDDIWLVSTNTASCSDASIAPLVTTTAQQLTGLTAATPARARSTDVRGNVTENALRFNAPFSVSVQSPPYAANDQLAVTRYGVELQTISISCVTNTFTYDTLGRKVATTDGRGNTRRTEFNAAGQQTAAIDALGNRTAYSYDQFGRLASATDPLGNATVYEYDIRGRKAFEGGATYPVRYTYDVFGNLSTLSTTRDGATWDTTAWAYDHATGLCTNKAYADGSSVSYTYTPDGKPLRTIYPSGRWKENTYDDSRRLVSTEYSDGEPDCFAYDVFGQHIAESNGVASTVYLRDNFGNCTNEAVVLAGGPQSLAAASTNTIERSFDAYGRLTRHSLCASAPMRELSYAPDGLISSISNAEAFVEYAYTPDRLDAGYTLTLTNGTVFTRTVVRDAYRRNLIIAITNSVNGIAVEALEYAYDALGRPISRNADAFGYNERGEVVFSRRGAEGAEDGYAYDGIGNLLEHSCPSASNTYVANNLNQYSSIYNLCGSAPLRELSYDLDGNLVTNIFNSPFSFFHSYAYDAASRLAAVSSNGTVVATYAYDAQGRRVRKETPSAAHTYTWDGWLLVRETITDLPTFQPFNFSTDYIWGKDISGALQGAGGIGGLLYLSVSNSSTHQLYIPFYDANGNITHYCDATGATVASYTYDAFGRTISATGPLAHLFRHRFSTKYYDTETGLYYYGYRYYSPVLMRWLNRDPIEEQGGVNLYAFCRNSPSTTIDPLGDSIMCCGNEKYNDNEKFCCEKTKKLFAYAREGEWNGLAAFSAFTIGFGVATFHVELTSNLTHLHKKHKLSLTALLAAASIGSPVTATTGKIVFGDYEPEDFGPLVAISSASAAIVGGLGGSVVRIGNAVSIGSGLELGFDYSVGSAIGRTLDYSVEEIPCERW